MASMPATPTRTSTSARTRTWGLTFSIALSIGSARAVLKGFAAAREEGAVSRALSVER
jgi:hypothetical protein